jgi:hypothetical protein
MENMENRFKSVGEAAEFLDVSVSTLRRWEASGLLVPDFRTVGGHRRYSLAALRAVAGLDAGSLETTRHSGDLKRVDLIQESVRISVRERVGNAFHERGDGSGLDDDAWVNAPGVDEGRRIEKREIGIEDRR